MDLISVAIVAAGLLVFSLVSGRLDGTVLTPPIAFIAFGFVIGAGGFAVTDLDPGHAGVHLIAEVTLVLVLFTDAARIDLGSLRRDHNVPQRMLVVGLPLTMLLGGLFAAWVFPDFSWWEAFLLAALLAPTDAALGQAVVSAKSVPSRIRQAINVESGLNDGIALPAVLLFAALAGAEQEATAGDWLTIAALQITLGPLIGGVVGFIGARCIDSAAERGWAGQAFQGIGILALALYCFALSELAGGNGFIAAFIGGMVFGNSVRNPCTFLFEFMETEGQLLTLVTFLIFGATLLPEGLHHIDGTTLVYAILSLTVIRMLPIALSLLGTGLRGPTVVFLGWFGPRGLASILFLLLILEDTVVQHRREIFAVTILTVTLSALLHGITSGPFSRLFGQAVQRMGECAESERVSELPLRTGIISSGERMS